MQTLGLAFYSTSNEKFRWSYGLRIACAVKTIYDFTHHRLTNSCEEWKKESQFCDGQMLLSRISNNVEKKARSNEANQATNFKISKLKMNYSKSKSIKKKSPEQDTNAQQSMVLHGSSDVSCCTHNKINVPNLVSKLLRFFPHSSFAKNGSKPEKRRICIAKKYEKKKMYSVDVNFDAAAVAYFVGRLFFSLSVH